jgi:quinol monooxygenase YgiN
MSQIVLVVSFKVKEGREAQALPVFQQVGEQTHAEDGCERYAWVRNVADRTEFALIEKWRDEDALASHRDTDHLAEFRARLDDLLTAPPVVSRYEELGFGTPHQGSV